MGARYESGRSSDQRNAQLAVEAVARCLHAIACLLQGSEDTRHMLKEQLARAPIDAGHALPVRHGAQPESPPAHAETSSRSMRQRRLDHQHHQQNDAQQSDVGPDMNMVGNIADPARCQPDTQP